MAGVKGKSGGARPGAGRKPRPRHSPQGSVKPPGAERQADALTASLEPQAHGGALKRAKAEPALMSERDMLQLLQDVALGRVSASSLQVRAAIAAVQYTHTKRHDGGKKDEKAAAAKSAGRGRFAAAAPPKLVVSNR